MDVNKLLLNPPDLLLDQFPVGLPIELFLSVFLDVPFIYSQYFYLGASPSGS